MQDYRKLRVWISAVELAINVRQATNGFPKAGYAELKGQMISAAESIVNNIVEGCGAETPKEFARFLSIAIKSAMELEGELELAHAYRILSRAVWHERPSCYARCVSHCGRGYKAPTGQVTRRSPSVTRHPETRNCSQPDPDLISNP